MEDSMNWRLFALFHLFSATFCAFGHGVNGVSWENDYLHSTSLESQSSEMTCARVSLRNCSFFPADVWRQSISWKLANENYQGVSSTMILRKGFLSGKFTGRGGSVQQWNQC